MYNPYKYPNSIQPLLRLKITSSCTRSVCGRRSPPWWSSERRRCCTPPRTPKVVFCILYSVLLHSVFCTVAFCILYFLGQSDQVQYFSVLRHCCPPQVLFSLVNRIEFIFTKQQTCSFWPKDSWLFDVMRISSLSRLARIIMEYVPLALASISGMIWSRHELLLNFPKILCQLYFWIIKAYLLSTFAHRPYQELIS